MKTGGRLKLFIDGRQAAQSDEFDAKRFDLTNDAPLRIGFGQYSHFKGRIRDVRIYPWALTETEVIHLQTNQ